ncbi:alpha/beta hydrolase [Streptomyces sp. NPDC050560]|uniref:alpha/beta hydrolase n=1 Tax=Streptomyces sp. NPDC050560 TaxID=3365630 RepID=UPI00379B9F56
MKKRAAALCSVAAALAAAVSAGPPAASDAGPLTRPAALAWKDCGTEDSPTMQCASLRVPLDHQSPRGRQITLALSRVPHTGKEFQGPLLVNPGGPGGSGLSLAGVVAGSLPDDITSQYDVIGFDPRGVGRSRPALDCVPGHFDPVRPASVPEGYETARENVQRARDFAEACGSEYAGLLPFMDTDSSARDMDDIRHALGAQRISYFGYSYGTYLGAVYGKLFPHRVHRMALDSVVTPQGVWYRDNLDQNIAFNARHQAFLAWVAKHDAAYHLGADPARVEDEWYAMRRAVTAEPAGGTVGGAELEDTFLPGGYSNLYWPRLAQAFSAYVKEKDTAPLLRAYRALGAQDATGDNNYSVYTAVQCRDAPWPRDWQTWVRDARRSDHKAPFSSWNNTWYNAPCAFWPVRGREPVDVSTNALPPVLLFQATGDAATPYEGGVAVHRALRDSSLVVEEGGGNHGVTLSGNACLDERLAAYLRDGTVPRGEGTVDAVCPALPDPEPAGTRRALRPVDRLHEALGPRGHGPGV